MNYYDKLGYNFDKQNIRYCGNDDLYMNAFVYNNNLLKKYYFLLKDKKKVLKGQQYAINKFERPLFKIGIPYDVVKLILTYLLKFNFDVSIKI
jgi:hypothetical protein